MISPHTPPGTKVVCIENRGDPVEPVKPVRPVIGAVYTLKFIYPCKYSTGGFACEIVELAHAPHGYSLRLFRRLELPKILTEIAAGAKPDPNAMEEPKRKENVEAGR